MINSRKAIWADNLRCAHVLKLPQAAFFLRVCMCLATAAEIYIVHSYCAGGAHIHLSLSLKLFTFQSHIKNDGTV